MADIVCVGFSCMDIQIQGIPVQNDRLVPIAFDRFGAAHAETIVLHGGDAMNEACVLGTLGCSVELATELGEDGAGLFLRESAIRCGVTVKPLGGDKSCPTNIAVNLIQENGERYYLLRSGMTEDSGNPENFPDILDGARIATLASIGVAPFHEREPIEKFLKAARDRGILTFVDFKLGNDMFGVLREAILDLFPLIDYAFPNEAEGKALTGETDPDQVADRLVSMGIAHVIYKRGKEGCIYADRGQRVAVPAYEVPMVDSTGAGDGFLAAFAAAKLEGRDDVSCCRFAGAVSALIIQAPGSMGILKGKEQVESFMKDQMK